MTLVLKVSSLQVLLVAEALLLVLLALHHHQNQCFLYYPVLGQYGFASPLLSSQMLENRKERIKTVCCCGWEYLQSLGFHLNRSQYKSGWDQSSSFWARCSWIKIVTGHRISEKLLELRVKGDQHSANAGVLPGCSAVCPGREFTVLIYMCQS